MTVYVDDMKAEYGQMKMCHMLASTDAELHAMADLIGVARKWWQSPARTSGSHYDIAMSKRAIAISLGAVEITIRQAAAMNAMRRITGELGTPESAWEWRMEQRLQRNAKKDVNQARAQAQRQDLDLINQKNTRAPNESDDHCFV